MWKMMEILTKTDEISSIFCDRKTKNPTEKENFFDKKQIEKPKNKNFFSLGKIFFCTKNSTKIIKNIWQKPEICKVF